MANKIIKVEPLTKEAFAPFGHVLMLNPGTPLLKTVPPVFTDRIPFEVDDGDSEFVCAVLERQKDYKFSVMERHLKVTQGFFPMFGGPAIATFAPATDPNDLESLPPVESVRAFLFESYNGIVIHRGVWHGKMFPLEEKFAYMMASRVETTDDALNPLYDSDVQIRDLGTTFELLL